MNQGIPLCKVSKVWTVRKLLIHWTMMPGLMYGLYKEFHQDRILTKDYKTASFNRIRSCPISQEKENKLDQSGMSMIIQFFY